jgi:NAD(P)-dependent dehydrogenase (short-subunit alcohol dehydrogenase family)
MRSPSSRNIVILGASSEIGRSLALAALKRSGYRLLLASRSPVDWPISQESSQWQYLHGLDFTIEEDLLRLGAAVRDFFTEPFSVVHSVGDFWTHKPLVRTTFSELRTMYESHYLTLCGAAHSLIPVLIEKGGGQLIAFSCNSVSYNYPDMYPFTSAKAAIESMVKCLAHEYAEYGISVAALALPTIRTQRVLAEKPQGDHTNYLSPEDLAEILLDNVLLLPTTVNGNILKVFKYSRAFYHLGYFERNPRREE